ncbi:MAG TPA: VOC family protein [Candidatus Acidoferrum sp.]|nr:VOC family protein [Candidatus Acidoferrum sp.]
MNKSQLIPYLNFNGNCEEAMQFYQSVLGGELKISRFADYASPEMPVADNQKNKVMHASLENDRLSLMASDGRPDTKVIFGDSVNMCIMGTDEAQLTGFFNGLAAGGTITMPLDKQVWGDKFGMCTDKFGINWMVNIDMTSAAETPK